MESSATVPGDRLAAERRGTGRRLVLVHGFTQTGRSWRPVAERLGDRYEVVTVDAPGHGDSPDVPPDVAGGAARLGTTGGRATYVGYSMGGRLCLQLALDTPDIVERLVLVSTTAGIEDPAERAARRAADDELADSIGRDGVDRFLERWVTQPLLASSADPDLADRRRNTAAGLAAALRRAGVGTQEPSWHRLVTLTMPVLLVAGSRDRKFVVLAERMAAAIDGATLVVIEDAGHTVPLDQPEEFLRALTGWLDLSP